MVSATPMPDLPAGIAPKPGLMPVGLTPCDQTALRRLLIEFREGRPLAVMLDRGRQRSARIVEDFIAALDADVEVVRFAEPCQDATDCMRDIVQRVGFEPKDFPLNDLENIFKMFLSYQKTHGRRTVLCLEEAQSCCAWVLDKITDLIKAEVEESLGLFVLLSGRQGLAELMNEAPLKDIAEHTGRHIPVAAFTKEESKDFVRRLLLPDEGGDLGKIVDYDAIAHLHRIAAGVPDRIHAICSRSLKLAKKRSSFPITVELIDEAAIEPAPARAARPASPAAGASSQAAAKARPRGRLIIRLEGEPAWVQAIRDDSLSMGRDATNGVQIASKLVSRNHAALVATPQGVKIVDLGSTNGTLVNGRRIKSCILRDGDEILLGDCRIQYACGSNGHAGIAHDTAEVTAPVNLGRDVDPDSRTEPVEVGDAEPDTDAPAHAPRLLETEAVTRRPD